MKSMMKKWLLGLLFALILHLLLPSATTVGYAAAEPAAGGFQNSGLSWHFFEDLFALTISGSGEMANCSPDAGNFAPWYYFEQQIQFVLIGGEVTSIGDYAFSGCSSLCSAVIPGSVTHIGENAFDGCDFLTIYGYPESAAQRYADSSGIPFVSLEARTLKTPLFGDLNDDGAVDAVDAIRLSRALHGLAGLEPAQAEAGDVDHDGELREDDLRKLTEYLVDLVANLDLPDAEQAENRYVSKVVPEITEGKYIDQGGKESNNSGYYYFFLDVQSGDVISGIRSRYGTTNNLVIAGMRFVCAYDADGKAVRTAGAENVKDYTVPEGITRIAITMNGLYNKPDYICIYRNAASADWPGSATGELEDTPQTVNGELAASSRLEMNANAVRKNKEIVFRGSIASFRSMVIGQGTNNLNSERIEIDEACVTVYRGTAQNGISVAHGLHISEEISVSIFDDNRHIGHVTVASGGETFTYTTASTYVGCSPLVYAETDADTSLTDCSLSFVCRDIESPVWVFGDSYVSYSADRWPYQLEKLGIDGFLLNGYSGEKSANAMLDLNNLLRYGTPNYLVWALGMNDADGASSVSGLWKSCYDELCAICFEKNIELILCTIPNVPGTPDAYPPITHTFKNNTIVCSGKQYIDFANAVGASEDAVWYDGMLSSDGIHPAEPGAVALAAQVLRDFPQICIPNTRNAAPDSLARSAATGMTFDAEPAEIFAEAITGRCGERLTASVTLSGNPGFAGFTLAIETPEGLTLTNIEQGSLLADADGLFTKNVAQGLINWTSAENIEGDGELILLSFEVGADTADGEYAVSIALKDGMAGNFANVDETPVSVKSGTGTVTVDNHEHSYTAALTPPTCTEQGYTTWTCECGDSYVSNYVDALGHVWDEPSYEWAEDNSEVTATRVCKRNATHTETETVKTVSELTRPATCTEKGDTTYTATFENAAFAAQTKTLTNVDALGHTPGEAVEENRVEPTCTENGGYDTVVYCTYCKAELSREYTELDLFGHDWDTPSYEWSEDNSEVTATRACKCDESHIETETANTTSEVTKEATETEEGEITYTASFTNSAFETQTKKVATPKLKPQEPTNPFDDVAEGKFYYDAVLWAVAHEPQITNGTDATHFSPNATCTRGQVVTFLWRAKGCPEPASLSEGRGVRRTPNERSEAEGGNPFTDVKEGSFYYKAVLWAVENEITNGTSATTFGPNDGCTRGQVVTFLWRTEGKPEPTTEDNPFTDVTGGFYYKAVLWAVEKKITNGTSATTFSPSATCTRGQIVTFLYRALAE